MNPNIYSKVIQDEGRIVPLEPLREDAFLIQEADYIVLSEPLLEHAFLIHQFMPLEEPATEPFTIRCSHSAEVALGIARLRNESLRVGFVALPMADYLQGLASAAGIRLETVLDWVGIPNIAAIRKIQLDSAQAIGRLARLLGLNLRQTLAYANMGFAEHLGKEILIGQMSARGRETHNPLLQCEELIQDERAAYTNVQMEELLNIELRIQEVYQEENTEA